MDIVEGVEVSKVQVLYVLYLPKLNQTLWASSLNYTPTVTRGKPWECLGNAALIPIDPHHALAYGWVSAEHMLENINYIPEVWKAAISLVEGVKNGNDT